MFKFDFCLKTRDGHRVESVIIHGKDKPDAERKLYQMYRYCEVLGCKTLAAEQRAVQSADIEDVLSLIAKQE
jgi:hypothetical protein